MNKKIFILYFLVFNLLNGYSQNAHLALKFKSSNKTPNGQIFEFYYNLLIAPNYTRFISYDSIRTNNPYLIQNTSKNNYGMYRDIGTDKFYYSAPILNKSFLVYDTSVPSKFNWKIIKDTSVTILGYHCNVAISEFRGRTYYANFTSEIPVDAGPYKFCGLPGIILEVKSTDNLFSYKAFEIKKAFSNETSANPYSNIDISNFISFQQYKKLLREKLSAIQRKRQAEEKDGFEYKVEDNSMELSD